MVVKNPAAHHAISAKFDKKIDNKDNTLVVQYEVKLQSKPLKSACQELLVVPFMNANQGIRWFGVWWCLHEAS